MLSFCLCVSVFTIRVAERVVERSRMSDGYTPRNEFPSFSVLSICAVSIIKSLRKQCAVDLYAQLYSRYSIHVIAAESGLSNRSSSYIALVGERNVTFGGCAVGCEIEQQHEIPRYKHAV